MTVSPPPGSHCCLLLALARRHSFALSAGRSVCLSVYLAVGPRHTRRASNNQTSFSLIKRRSAQAHDHGNHISGALSYGKRPNLERRGEIWGSIQSPQQTCVVHTLWVEAKAGNHTNMFWFEAAVQHVYMHLFQT